MNNTEFLNHQIVENPSSNEWLVFIHGAGGNMSTWKYQKEHFASTFNLLLIDLRDHGGSSHFQSIPKKYSFDLITNDIVSLLQFLAIKEAHFMSLSMGSLMLQHLALNQPALVKSAVVAGGVYHINESINLFVNTALFFTRILPYRTMYHVFSYLVMPRSNHQQSRKIYIEQSKKLSGAAYRRWITLYQEFRSVLRSFYDQPLTFPLLVVMGSQDYIFLSAAAKYVEKHSLATLAIMQGCGHICTLEQPHLFNQIVSEFYQKNMDL